MAVNVKECDIGFQIPKAWGRLIQVASDSFGENSNPNGTLWFEDEGGVIRRVECYSSVDHRIEVTVINRSSDGDCSVSGGHAKIPSLD